jgi:hypothetical protein
MMQKSDVEARKRHHFAIITTIVTILSIFVVADNVRHFHRVAKLSETHASVTHASVTHAPETHASETLNSKELKMAHESGKHLDKSILTQSGPFNPVPGVGKVKVDLYLESQDRATQVLTEWVLIPVVGSTDVDQILDLKVHAWGNAQLLNQDDSVLTADVNIEAVLAKGVPKFLCEHGPSECEGNAWINCLQDLYPDMHQWFRVFSCMETLSCSDVQAPVRDSIVGTGTVATLPCRGTPGEVVGECIREYAPDMDISALQQCVTGERGSRLLLQTMQKTAALDPPMDHVPWFVVEGKVINSPNRTDAFLLGKRVCDAYASKVRKFQKLSVNSTVELPQGCFLFPDAPPYFDVSYPVNQVGITILWIVGGALFGISVTLLICWKYHSSRET